MRPHLLVFQIKTTSQLPDSQGESNISLVPQIIQEPRAPWSAGREGRNPENLIRNKGALLKAAGALLLAQFTDENRCPVVPGDLFACWALAFAAVDPGSGHNDFPRNSPLPQRRGSHAGSRVASQGQWLSQEGLPAAGTRMSKQPLPGGNTGHNRGVFKGQLNAKTNSNNKYTLKGQTPGLHSVPLWRLPDSTKFPLVLPILTSQAGKGRLGRATLIKSEKRPYYSSIWDTKNKDHTNDLQTLGEIFFLTYGRQIKYRVPNPVNLKFQKNNE